MATPITYEGTYRLQFHDLWDVTWTAIFYLDGYTGALTDLQGSDEAIVFDFENDSDDPFGPIKPSQVTFNVILNENESLSTLFEVGDMELWVEVFQGNDYSSDTAEPFWCGWVDPYQYQQPYDVRPNVVTITAVDGLSLLDDILFADEDSAEDTEYYTGRSKETKIILDILGKIGYSEFKEFDNIFEERMDNDPNLSPMELTLIDADFGKEKSCKEVLSNILSKKKACIRQRRGVFCIYRPKAVVTADTIYGRHFTAETTKTSISYNPNQYIRRDGHDTNLRQVPGGVESIVKPAKRISLFQDYGNKESWIKNYVIEENTYDRNLGQYEYWTPIGDVLWTHMTLPNQYKGILIEKTNELINPPGVCQSFGTYIVASDDTLVFSIDYMFANYSVHGAAEGVYIYIMIESDSSNNWLMVDDDEYCKWSPSKYWVKIGPMDIESGISGWTTFSRKVRGIPVSGSYTITLWGVRTTQNVMVVYTNILFYGTSDELTRKKRPHKGPFPNLARLVLGVSEYVTKYVDKKEVTEAEHRVDNDIKGIEIEYQEVLGDVVDSEMENIIEQFSGALAIEVVASLSDGINSFVADHSADYLPNVYVGAGSNGKTLIFTGLTNEDFSGATTIENTDGDVDGSVENTQAFSAGTAQVDTFVCSSATGSTFITIGTTICELIGDGISIETTIDDFISTYGTTYFVFEKVSLSRSGSPGTNMLATANVPGDPFTASVSGTGPVASHSTTTPNSTGTARIDTITLSGTNGTADITCNGETQEISVGETTEIVSSKKWYILNEDSSESTADELLDLMAAEVAKQYSRTTRFIQMPIQELSGETNLNLIGNLQDTESNGIIGSNLISSLSNNGYDTFTVDGVKITSAINTGDAAGAVSNTLTVTKGEFIKVRIDLTLNSGQAPVIFIGVAFYIISNAIQLENGINEVTFEISDSRDDVLLTFVNSEATNYSTGDIELYHTGVRKYVINRGTFNVRSRTWDLDLQEMVE